MNFKSILLGVAAIAVTSNCAFAAKDYKVSSPDGNITINVTLGEGKNLYYSVTNNGKTILNPSKLGLDLENLPDMAGGFKIDKATTSSFSETWKPVWGEESEIESNYNELRLDLSQPKVAPGRKMAVVFRAFNDGIGFRYEYPKQKALGDFVVLNEYTEFNFPENHSVWSIPFETNYYEGVYDKKPLDQIGRVSTPITIKAADGTHLAIHEANLTDFPSMNLQATPGSTKLVASPTLMVNGKAAEVSETRVTPWRTLIIAPNAADMMLSRLMLNLNEPCVIEDTSWIKPARYIGIWWVIHLQKASFAYEDGPLHVSTTENAKRYIDFAAKNGFGGVLVEGWNKGWANKKATSFTESYPDFNLPEVAAYAKSKGVEYINHQETFGFTDMYERQMDDAFKMLQDNDIHYVKTGYAGDPLTGGEHRSSQVGVRHFRKVAEEAAKYKINLDNHEFIMPTGLQRTYPNLMTQEDVRGQEWNAWDLEGGSPTRHFVTLPFTRGLAGPMDFTPGTFRVDVSAVPGTRVRTTLAQQLAQFLIFYTPLQMASDEIEAYEENPGPFQFITDCPTDWDRTLFPEAEIGEYITVARKAKDSDSWYVAGATNENGRVATVELSFLEPDTQYIATIYRDADNASWDKNPYPVTIERRLVKAGEKLYIREAPGGGFAMKIAKTK